MQAEKITSWLNDGVADCGVVLTGGTGRVREGFDLLSRGEVKKLIISGVNPKARLRDILPEWPFYGNLNESDVILERHSGSTYGNARQSLTLVQAMNCQSILLVTSRLHMYRAYRTFGSIFPDDVQINKHAVGDFDDLGTGVKVIEVMKSLFYSTWAY